MAGDGREKRGEGEEDKIWDRSKGCDSLHESQILEIMLEKNFWKIDRFSGLRHDW